MRLILWAPFSATLLRTLISTRKRRTKIDLLCPGGQYKGFQFSQLKREALMSFKASILGFISKELHTDV